jgi:hypothetical protein
MIKTALEKGRFFHGTVLLEGIVGRGRKEEKYENTTLDFLQGLGKA